MGDDGTMMNNAKPVLQIKGLTKNYHDGPDSRDIIKDLDLTVNQGDFLTILGPSGCGKTTLIRCIAGFEDFEGQIMVDGKEVREPGIDRFMVFQTFEQLFPWKTVKNNITYPLKQNGMKDKEELDRIAEEHLELVGLAGKGDLYPHQLSGGMKQRVAIAKGLALNPKIILMDEPFAALDAMTRNKLQAELVKIKERENATVIFITHNIQEALVLGTRIMLMSKQGEIKINIDNDIPKPVTPASEGYGQLWKKLNDALWEEDDSE
ncbi:MAG: ABC transporter ATP-binding protein [Clostridia bacterium]|nr:ABC transporter ATP-binding protein [Clostridia bacterium]